MKKQNNPEARKLLINSKINQFNNDDISLEGFFDFLFGKKKEVEVKRNIDSILEYVKNSTDVKIESQFKDFDDYIKVLEDLVDNVLTDYNRNIDRVTKFLNFFLQHREKIINFKSELKKLGDFNISTVKVKDRILYKSRYHSSAAIGGYTGLDNLDIDLKELSEEQLDFLKFLENLVDIDLLFVINVETFSRSKITLDETQTKTLEKVLIELQKKLPNAQSKASKLQELFQKSEKTYREILEHLSFPEGVTKDNDYIGFGAFMYQNLGYLYEIEYGIEFDLNKEIK